MEQFETVQDVLRYCNMLCNDDNECVINEMARLVISLQNALLVEINRDSADETIEMIF